MQRTRIFSEFAVPANTPCTKHARKQSNKRQYLPGLVDSSLGALSASWLTRSFMRWALLSVSASWVYSHSKLCT
jgi:hypothetical protein